MNKNLMKVYEIDASQFKGKAADVLFPKTIMDVRNIVAKNKRVVVRGGGTGLSGGCVPQNGLDVVLDLSKLTGIGNFDKNRMVVEVEAGVILDDLQNYLRDYALEFPVNPSSHAVATIGGMIATDAVGSRAVRYGKVSNWIKWIEVVDGYGNLSRKGVTELSDYCGMEGITGVVVRVCLKLSTLKKRSASLMPMKSIPEIVEIVRKLKRDSSVSMIEFLDKKISTGLSMDEKYHLIVEYENGSGFLKGEEYMAVLAMRDKAYPFVAGDGYYRIEDPKILLDRFDKFMNWIEANNIIVFGHLGVGILHPCFDHDQEKLIPEMMRLVKRLGGQITGEHGVGILKKPFVEVNDKKILINVKKRTDPMGKFNVGKII